MTLIEDIANALTSAGYSNIIAYHFDHTPDDQICIAPGGGTITQTFSGEDVEYPKVQILVRHTDLRVAESRIFAIRDLLHTNTNVSNTVIVQWDGRYPTHWTDENGLHVFEVEFTVVKV